MDTHTITLIALLIFLLICSAFFSASETAFSSLNRIKIKSWANHGNKKAAKVLALSENYDKLLSAVLIGNNVVNIASSSIAAVIFMGFFGNFGVTISTLVMTVLVLVVGEISPKTLAKESPEQFAMFSAPILKAFMILLAPTYVLVRAWKKMIVKLFRLNADRSVTEEELLTFVEEVRQEGGINEREEDMIKQAIEFDDLTANDILTPRVDVEAVSLEDSIEEIERQFFSTRFSRLPVYKNSIDNITGVILQKDFHYKVMKMNHPLESIIKPIVFTTKSIKIAKLLKTLQEKKSHIAVIIDEFGGTVGIVTIEDIVEELVGEIWDEHDDVVEKIIKIDEFTYKIIGNTELDELFELFGKKNETNSNTVGSWVIETIGGIPKEGYSFTFENLTITISKTLRHRVMEVMVKSSTEEENSSNERE
jgi:CBS domain containing-hemolysin-like protein